MRLSNKTLFEINFSAFDAHRKVSRLPILPYLYKDDSEKNKVVDSNRNTELFRLEFQKFLRNIDEINRLTRYETEYQGMRFDEIEIADVFKPLIAPASVTLSGGKDEEDLLTRAINGHGKYDVVPDLKPMTREEFSIFASMINGVLKRDGISKLSDLRKDVCLTVESAKSFYQGYADDAIMHNQANWNVIPFQLEWTPFDQRFMGVDPGEVIEFVLRHLYD